MNKETENQLKDRSTSVVGICAGCFERGGLSEVEQQDYLRRLQSMFPHFSFETYSCLRLCPENRITLEIPRDGTDSQLAMARSLKIEDVMELIYRMTGKKPKGETNE